MKSKIFSLCVGLLFTGSLLGQSDLTLYNFNAIAQSLHVNPAQPQQTKFWLGLPVASGIHLHVHNSGFALIDIIGTGTNINQELKTLAGTLDEDSYLAYNQTIDLLGLGFKVGKGFVSLGATQQIDFSMTYPAELLTFISWEEGDPITGFSLDDLTLESMVRTNIYAGYQHTFLKDRLTLGFRGKYIFGQQNSFIERFNVGIDATDPFSTRITSNTIVRSSGLANILEENSFDDPVSLAMPDNTGLAWDIGFNYRINKRFSVSGSALDIGSITWQDGNEDYVSIGEFDFEGLELDFSQDDFSNVVQELEDSITETFQFDTLVGASYTRQLSPRYFAAANFHLTDKHAFGILYHGRSWNGNLYNDYSINYQGRWFRGLQFIASYSIINGTTNNVGAGIDFKLGPLQLYLISDNVLGAVMYENLQTANFRMGLNITFYGRKDESDTEKIENPVEAPVEEEAEEEE